MKQIVEQSLNEWSFYAFTIIYIAGTLFVSFSGWDTGAGLNQLHENFYPILSGIILGSFVFTALYLYATYRIRIKFNDELTGSLQSLIFGFIKHGLKSFLVLIPFLLLMAMIMFTSADFENPDQTQKQGFDTWLKVIPFYMIATMWAGAGISIVICQMNSKRSIRNSFRVLVKRFKILFVYGIVTVVSLTIPYAFPGNSGGDMTHLGILPKLLVNLIYLLLFLFSFYMELYIAKSLLGTDLIYPERQPVVETRDGM